MPVDIQKLTEPFPQTAIKQRQGGGGRMLDYVEGHTIIHRLNAATDNHWSFRVLSLDAREIQTRNGAALLMTATVELEIPGHGSRQHIGVQMVNDAGGEDLAKGAITDALKKAATLFGVGLELYGPDYESGEIAAPQQRAVRGPQPPRYAQAAANDAARGPGADSSGEPTDKQKRFMRKLADDMGWQPDEVRAVINQQFGKESSKELTRHEMSQLIEILQLGAEQPTLA